MSAVFAEVPGSVLAIYAHPDDPEISCGGALATWAGVGATVGLVIATLGEKGSDDASVDPRSLATRRAEEATEAAAALGVARLEMLGYPDGELSNDRELRSRLVALIREAKPDVVVAPDPTAIFFGSRYVNHRDHREVGWAALDACAPAAGSPLYHPESGPAHHVATLLLSGTLEPDCWVDITPGVDAKVDAVRCHRSQLGEGEDMADDLVRARAAEEGRAAGLGAAEGFRRIQLG